MIHLVPVKDARVRDPETKKLIGKEGIKIEELTPFFYRRMQDGELEEMKSEEQPMQVASLVEKEEVAPKKKGDK